MNDLTCTEVPTTNSYFYSQNLEQKIKKTYQNVAQNPEGELHFSIGSQLAERLGYPEEILTRLPPEAIQSFSGVGYHFHLANLKAGEKVIDLGSGSGMDSFYASIKVGETGQVTGIDMTDEQLNKAERLRIKGGFNNLDYLKAYIQSIPCEDESFDAVISNGVINQAVDKYEVFEEVERLLKPGGRLVVSDIVTMEQLPQHIIANDMLWSARIAGALYIDHYIDALYSAGLIVEKVEYNNDYQFLCENTQDVIEAYGVKSISLLARRPHPHSFLIF